MGDDLKRASGLFEKQGRKGRYWSGNVTVDIPAGSRLLVFENEKRRDNDPDFTLHFVAAAGETENQPPMRRAEPNRGRQSPPYKPETIHSFVAPTDEDVPF
jgi:hypothetical protein